MNFKALLIRHLQSAGFKRRFRNIYWPFIKQTATYLYRVVHGKLEQRQFAEQYKGAGPVVEGDEGADRATYSGGSKVLKEEDAIELLKENYLIDHEPQEYGTCVAHTMKNIHRFVVKVLFGGTTDFSEHDVYIDRETRNSDIDGGMNPSKTLERMSQKGIAIKGVVPTATKKDDLKTVRADYPDQKVQPFRVTMVKSHKFVSAEMDFEPLWAYITETYERFGVRPFQFSIVSRQGWWGNDVPKATGGNYGGHSVMGLTIPFTYRGKRAFFAIDSSYRRGTSWQIAKGVRIVTEDCWNGLGRNFRPVEFINEIEQHFTGSTDVITPDEKPERLTVTAALNQNNIHVTKIQKALIANGFEIPAITAGDAEYGYYGQQTADAVLNFHMSQAPAFLAKNSYWTVDKLQALNGMSFGELSIEVMNELNGY